MPKRAPRRAADDATRFVLRLKPGHVTVNRRGQFFFPNSFMQRGIMSRRPKYLGHVNIFVRNIERSQKWYQELLDLHTYDYRPGNAVFMSADIEQSHEVALIQLGDEASGPERGQVGLNHMAWMMENLDDLKEVYQRIIDRDIPIERVSDHGVSIGIYLRDPDGNGVEVSYELPRSEWARQEKLFTDDGGIPKGQFPGPWEHHFVQSAAVAR